VFLPSVVILCVVMPSVVMPSVVMPSVVIGSVDMLRVVICSAMYECHYGEYCICYCFCQCPLCCVIGMSVIMPNVVAP
jgi:hypothetical protein